MGGDWVLEYVPEGPNGGSEAGIMVELCSSRRSRRRESSQGNASELRSALTTAGDAWRHGFKKCSFQHQWIFWERQGAAGILAIFFACAFIIAALPCCC